MKREKRLDQLLERSLLALDRTGDVNAVLRRYPEEAENLRPLLEMAQEARCYYDDVPDPPEGLKAGRERFLQEAARQREQGRVAAPVTRREKVRVKERRLMFRFAFATKLISAVLAVIIGVTAVWGGVSMASADSLPGEVLYPAKVSLENARMALALTSDDRFNLALRFADERLAEIERMTQQGQSVPDETVARMHQLLNRAMTQAARSSAEEMPAMLERIVQRTQTQVQAMERLQSRAQEKNRTQIANALHVCQQARERAMAGLEDPQTFRAQHQQREGMPEDVTPPTPPSREPGGRDPEATPGGQRGGSDDESDGGEQGGPQGNGIGGQSDEDDEAPGPGQQRGQDEEKSQDPNHDQQQGPSGGDQDTEQNQQRDQHQEPAGEPNRDQDQGATDDPDRDQGQPKASDQDQNQPPNSDESG